MKSKEILKKLGIITALSITTGSVGAISSAMMTYANENATIEDEYNPEDDVITTKYGAYLPSEEELINAESANNLIDDIENIKPDLVNPAVYGPAPGYIGNNSTVSNIGTVGGIIAIGGAITAVATLGVKNSKHRDGDDTSNKK